jgi:hypothetical protein
MRTVTVASEAGAIRDLSAGHQRRVDRAYAEGATGVARAECARAARHLAIGEEFLAGGLDAAYHGPTEAYGSVEAYRAFYAAHCAEMAAHHLAWGEFHAGLRDHASALAEDPFSQPVF